MNARPRRSAWRWAVACVACSLAPAVGACGARSGLDPYAHDTGIASDAGDSGGAPGTGGKTATGGVNQAGTGTGGLGGTAGTGGVPTTGGTGGSSGSTDAGTPNCPPGTWNDAGTCTPWTDCPPGTIVIADPSPTSDRRCAPCPEGETSTEVNARTCLPRPTELAVRDDYSCALLPKGTVKCWGDNIYGVLGRGNTIDVDDPASIGPVSVTTAPGVTVTELAAGWYHACALLSDLSVKCWGYGKYAELGYGNTENIGDDELPSSIGPVSITTDPNVTVKSLAPGFLHGCAVLSDGSIKCWGGPNGLGYGNTNTIGDDELPSSVGPVSVTTEPGVSVLEAAAGESFTCALLSDRSVKCWGSNRLGTLGYGNTNTIGDDELPSSVGPVSVTDAPGVTVQHLSAGFEHVCALLSDGSLKCWGHNDFGQLGYGNTEDVGDDETPSSVGSVGVSVAPGVTVTAVAAGGHHTCAVLSNGAVECWGLNRYGQLGYGNTENIGDDEPPSLAGAVSVTTAPGITVKRLALGDNHTCAVLSDDSVRCWGRGAEGQLGTGNTEDIGDDELPSSVGPVRLF